MSELVERVLDEARSAWRFRWTGMALAAVVALAGWGVVLSMPDHYEATGSVFVDTRTALQPVLEGLTVEQDVGVQLNYVRQSLLTGSLLRTIAEESGVVTPDMTDEGQLELKLQQFGELVQLEVTNASGSSRDTAGSIYSFSYQDTDRALGLKVVQTVIDKFIDETLGGKRRGSQGAQAFLEEQARDLEVQLQQAEARLADFKMKHIGLMPTEGGDNYSQYQAELDQARKVQNDLDVAISRRAELARQLRGDVIVGAAASPPAGAGAGAAGGDTVTRIQETQARLDELLLRYTDRHPDVIAARSSLEELQRRRQAELDNLRRGDAAAVASSGLASNPVYQSIQLQLNQADLEIASLRRQLAQHREKSSELQLRLDTAPKVEAEFAALNRDYDIKRAQYTALLANLEKARLGEEADTAGSVRFEVVEPVSSPFTPVWPPRNILMAGVLALALAAGGALCWLLHSLSPVVGSMRSLVRLVDVPVIGVVSAAFPDRLRAAARGQALLLLGVTLLLFGAFAALVVASSNGFRLGGAG